MRKNGAMRRFFLIEMANAGIFSGYRMRIFSDGVRMMKTMRVWTPLALAGVLVSCSGDFPEQTIGDGGVMPRVASIDFSEDTITSGGYTTMEFRVVNGVNNRLYSSSDMAFDFVSRCILDEKAEVLSPTESERGIFITTYIAKGCVGNDTVEVRLSEGESASRSIRIEPAVNGALEGLPPEFRVIAIKNFGTDNRPSQTRVPFRVRDEQGNPLTNQRVDFNVPNPVGGVSLAASHGVTDNEGIVHATVKSGTVNTVFKVQATTTIGNNTLVTENPYTITVNSGLPMHLVFGPDVLNPADAGIRFGVEEPISMVLTDRTGGPPAEGTVVTLKTNAGLVVGDDGGPVESCVVVGGRCSLTWVSGAPWPRDGGVRILAATRGDEYFIDENGNGVYDIGELFCPTGEPFLDENNNGVYDFGEKFIDSNGNGVFNNVPATYRRCPTNVTNRADALAQPDGSRFADGTGSIRYQGSSCSDAARAAGHCAQLGWVTDDAVMILTDPNRYQITRISSGSLTAGVQSFSVADTTWGNIPEQGTSFDADCAVGSAEIVSPADGSMPNLYQPPGTAYVFAATFQGSPVSGCYVEVGDARLPLP